MNERKLVAGDLVVCIDNSDEGAFLTLGQTYLVVRDEDTRGLCYIDEDDSGVGGVFFAWRFVRDTPIIEVDGVKYTKGEVEAIIREFLKGVYRE
jgi:hypothetical protein